MTKKDIDIQMPEMFSKAGRFTQQKYIVFQRQKQVSQEQNEQTKSKYTQQMKEQEFNIKLKPEFQKISKQTQGNHSLKKIEHKIQIKQPFQKITSRENAQYLKQVKNPPPPCGHYHPKFNEIDKKVHHCDIFYEIQKSETRKQTEELGDYDREMIIIAEKSPSKVYGRVHFPHFTSRKKYLSMLDPHEKRFETFRDTFFNSRLLRPQNVLLNKNLGREDFEHLNKKNSCPDYDKNYDQILKKTILMVPHLSLTTGRRLNEKVSSCTSENYFDYGLFTPREKSQVFRSVKKVYFNKQLSRYTDEKSHIPSFMQKNMVNRQSLNQINQKMLETNSFAEAKFQTVYTSFQRNDPKNIKIQSDIDQTLQTLYSIE